MKPQMIVGTGEQHCATAGRSPSGRCADRSARDERFAQVCGLVEPRFSLAGTLAKEGDRPAVGTVLLAGTNDHLRFISGERVGYTPEPRELAYRPSVDVFFTSVGVHWAGEAVGVL